eukprot:5125770-Amphidinium_carterae.1
MATWEDATLSGNPTLALASRMLPQSWLVSLPLDDPGCPEEVYCEAVIVAFHLATNDPGAPISAVVIAVPEEVALSVTDASMLVAPLYMVGNDEPIEDAPVGLVVSDPVFLTQKLVTATPAEASLVQFSQQLAGCCPKASELFGMMELVEPFNKGSLIHFDPTSTVVRVTSDGYESEGGYQSALEEVEPIVMVTQLSAPGVKRRRFRGKNAPASLLGFGASPAMLTELINAAKGKAATPRQTSSAKAKAAPPAPPSSSQQEILALLQSLGDRMTRLEHGQSMANMPRPRGAQALPMPSMSSGQAPPPGVGQRPLSVLSPHRPALPAGPGPSMPQVPSLPFPLPGQDCAAAGDQAYQSSVKTARRLLGAAPSNLPHVQPGVMEAAGIPSPRERPLAGLLRSGTSGAPDQSAVNIALIEALDRIGRGRRSDGDEGESFDDLLMAGETELDALKLTGARGAAAMAKIARSVEREPEKWIAHLDLQAYRACGSEQTGLP